MEKNLKLKEQKQKHLRRLDNMEPGKEFAFKQLVPKNKLIEFQE